MKTLVTHINPHLDDIAAIWLIKKFFPEFERAEVKFISAQQTDTVKDDKDTLTIGVGRGKYDEHKGDLAESAMSLVWKDIKDRRLAPADQFETKALDEIVGWNTLIDTAKMPFGEWDDFNVDVFLRSSQDTHQDSLTTVILGGQILDRILPVLVKKQRALKDWEKKIEFFSKWGKSVGIESADFNKRLAYGKGYMVVVQKDPERGYIGITAPGTSNVDLTAVFEKLKQVDPGADWFLHHGKKMILCGSDSAPDSKKSNLVLSELINLVKSV